VIIDAWTMVNCRNVSRWGREHVNTNIAVRFYITSSKRNGKTSIKQETTSRNIINAWDSREKKALIKTKPKKATRKKWRVCAEDC
jgi:hypothetical protein